MIVFITGANKGLGHEAARRLSDLGHEVIIGARDIARGQAAAAALGKRFVQIDVTDDGSVRAAADDVSAHEGHIDVLINNAGVSEGMIPIDQLQVQQAQRVYDTNVFGVIRVTSAFLPLLRKSAEPVIVNVSSGLGSFARTHDTGSLESQIVAPIYTSSKAALSMLTTQYSKAFPEMRVNAVDPGFTATDLNGGRGVQTVAEGTDVIIAMAILGPDGPTGTFQDRHGHVGW